MPPGHILGQVEVSDGADTDTVNRVFIAVYEAGERPAFAPQRAFYEFSVAGVSHGFNRVVGPFQHGDTEI